MKRIPMKGGDEYDALTKDARRYHSPGPGVRARLKRRYWHRFRRLVRAMLRRGEV
jgi:hypothetical protein